MERCLHAEGDGNVLPIHRWILETTNRIIETCLFLALNDPAGQWTLIVRDAATGVRREVPIEFLSELDS